TYSNFKSTCIFPSLLPGVLRKHNQARLSSQVAYPRRPKPRRIEGANMSLEQRVNRNLIVFIERYVFIPREVKSPSRYRSALVGNMDIRILLMYHRYCTGRCKESCRCRSPLQII